MNITYTRYAWIYAQVMLHFEVCVFYIGWKRYINIYFVVPKFSLITKMKKNQMNATEINTFIVLLQCNGPVICLKSPHNLR